jgi:hypothetical protein
VTYWLSKAPPVDPSTIKFDIQMPEAPQPLNLQ